MLKTGVPPTENPKKFVLALYGTFGEVVEDDTTFPYRTPVEFRIWVFVPNKYDGLLTKTIFDVEVEIDATLLKTSPWLTENPKKFVLALYGTFGEVVEDDTTFPYRTPVEFRIWVFVPNKYDGLLTKTIFDVELEIDATLLKTGVPPTENPKKFVLAL